MTGKERVLRVLARKETVSPPPCAPILHSGLAPIVGVPLGEYFSSAEAMARTILEGWRRFGYEGVQLSSGVTAEAEALGAPTEQPAEGAPLLKEHILADASGIEALREIDVTTRGRLPMFREALEMVARQVGEEACTIATIRGPLLMAAQLMGTEGVLMSAMTDPEGIAAILDFTNDVARRVGAWLAGAGADALVIGEATCSPNFIAPDMYREMVRPRHAELISTLKAAGWQAVGLHICGNVEAIVDDVVATGVTFYDVDYQAPLGAILEKTAGRAAMRGNLDPSAQMRFGDADIVTTATREMRAMTDSAPWVVSSGCDIPPGTPAQNIEALVRAAQSDKERSR